MGSDMENMIKITIIVIVALVTAGLIKEREPEFATVFTVAVALILIILIIPSVNKLVDNVNRFFSKSEINQFIMPVVKVLGITTVMKIISDMCVDAGEKAIGHITEIIGVICAVVSVIPLISSLIENVGNII